MSSTLIAQWHDMIYSGESIIPQMSQLLNLMFRYLAHEEMEYQRIMKMVLRISFSRKTCKRIAIEKGLLVLKQNLITAKYEGGLLDKKDCFSYLLMKKS